MFITLPILLKIAVILYGVKSSRGSPLEKDETQQKVFSIYTSIIMQLDGLKKETYIMYNILNH